MPDRPRFAGMLAIVRYNWPFYLAAAVVLATGIALLASKPAPLLLWPALIALAASFWFLAGSLAASHWVYDRSPLYRWKWLPDRLPAPPRDAIVCVSGFDEASAPLAAVLPDTRLTVLDHYDAGRMTEASIHRARRAFPPGPESVAAPFDDWPPRVADLVLAPLSIHEFRAEAERAAWFRSARAALRDGGRIVVVEHVRDPANFLAFGPGFLHFHPVASWRRAWEAAGLGLAESFRITPFVRVFVLK